MPPARTVAVVEGEAVLESRIAARGGGAGLAAIIPPGMRAVAVRVNDRAKPACLWVEKSTKAISFSPRDCNAQ